jgi:hypothetical protein
MDTENREIQTPASSASAEVLRALGDGSSDRLWRLDERAGSCHTLDAEPCCKHPALNQYGANRPTFQGTGKSRFPMESGFSHFFSPTMVLWGGELFLFPVGKMNKTYISVMCIIGRNVGRNSWELAA